MIALAVVCGIAPLLLWIAQPGFMRPMFGVTPWPVDAPAMGLAIYFIGLGWMVRIYRASANPEPDARNWRYRDV